MRFCFAEVKLGLAQELQARERGGESEGVKWQVLQAVERSFPKCIFYLVPSSTYKQIFKTAKRTIVNEAVGAKALGKEEASKLNLEGHI